MGQRKLLSFDWVQQNERKSVEMKNLPFQNQGQKKTLTFTTANSFLSTESDYGCDGIHQGHFLQ